MITKITIAYPTSHAYTQDAQYEYQRLTQCVKDVKNDAEHFAKIASVLALIEENYPDRTVRQCINEVFGPAVVPDMKHTTKTKRSYWIPNLYIHEEITKEQAEAENLFYKKMLTHVLIGEPGNFTDYEAIDVKVPIKNIVEHDALRESLVMVLTTIELKKGQQILNTNIPADLISAAG